MDVHVVQGSIGMTRGSLLRIEDGRDRLVDVRHGEVWLTQEGDRRDYLLKAGQRLRLDRDGTAIAYSLSPSVLTFT